MGKVAICFGTRPEIIKLAPLIKLLGDSARLIHTGQHFDDGLSRRILSDLGVQAPRINLGVGGTSRVAQIGHAMTAAEPHLSDCEAVVVQGDTNSALAGGLAANAIDLPLFHVEAGLRSYDRRMPEEHNRVLIDHLADVCWAPTEVNVENLAREGIGDARVRLTGNSIVEALESILPAQDDAMQVLRGLGLEPRKYVLATLHRPENVDDPEQLKAAMKALSDLPLPVVFPVHPRTAASLERHGLDEMQEGLITIPPVGYIEFVSLLSLCSLAVSDSGGIQEEVSIVKVPLVVLRRSTERPEVLGNFATLTSDPAEMHQHALARLNGDLPSAWELTGLGSPYGDGSASDRMYQDLVARGVV